MLARVGRLDLLPSLYGQVFIPPVVHGEVTTRGSGAAELARAPWLIVEPPRDIQAVEGLRQTGLGLGEAEAIVLAGQLGARLILDERRGSRIARQRGVPVVGTVAVIVAASRLGVIGVDEVEPLLRQMVTVDFHLSEQVIRLAVAEAQKRT